MSELIPGLIMGFREGLEAFLVIGIILRYLTKIDQTVLNKRVFQGTMAGVACSVGLGVALHAVSDALGGVEKLTKVWESVASLAAVLLVTTFIIWMIRHGHQMAAHVKDQVAGNLSSLGVFLVSFMMVAREGTEIALFSFAGKYPLGAVLTGVAASLLLAILIYYSLVRVNIGVLFSVTLAYLILQAGFLTGYALHEGLAALKTYGLLATDNILLAKAFNLSSTVLNHKQGALGMPLYVAFGWYSKPEWIQFAAQYCYTIGLFCYWLRTVRRRRSALATDSA